MPISRPLLIVLVAAVLALVGFYATQGSRDSVDSAPVTVSPPPDAGAPAGKADEPPAVAKVDKSEAQAQEPAKPSKSESKAGEQQSAKPDPKPDAEPKAKAKATKAKADKAAARPVSGPVAVRRAIDRKQRVVLFFGTPRGADDRATAAAVTAQRSRGVVVVLEPLENLVKYRELIGGLGISQAPAVVVVGKNGAARLVEGYVDPATLAQEVADAR